MLPTKYFLYIDEMQENLSENINYFCLAGFIVSETERDILDIKMNELKSKYGIADVIHWTELRRFKGIWQRKKNDEIKSFLEDFTKIINESSLVIIASMYDVKLISDNIKSKKWLSHRHIYCMKKIFENFFIFLNKENIHSEVEGYIIVEASTIDEEIKKLFHSVMIFGTDFVSQQGLGKFIKGIEFTAKSQDNNLLQIADPMPSELHRFFKDNNSFSHKLKPFKNEFQTFRNTLDLKIFTGYTNRKDLFGLHILD